MISIIIPVYQVEKYLKNCLESVLWQDYSDYEIIIVDDGSTDGSGAIADAYAAEYPGKITVIHQANMGLGGARNTGIEQAKGEFLFFLDSDDTISAHALKVLAQHTNDPTVDIIIFDFLRIDERGKVLGRQSENLPLERIFTLEDTRSVLHANPSAVNKLFRAYLFKETQLRFPAGLWFEDLATIPMLYTHAKGIRYIQEPLYLYLQREGSIMKNRNIARNGEIIDAVNLIIAYFQTAGLYMAYREELEFLAVYHIYIIASVRVLLADPKNELLGRFRAYLKARFPDYHLNQYINKLDKNKRLIYTLLNGKHYRLIRAIFKMKKVIGR